MSTLNLVLRRFVVGPPARILFPAHVVGRENLPKDGPFIIAAGPHRSELESALLACNLSEYELHFFAKAEYWEGSRLHRWFMDGTGMIPINRQDSRAALRQIQRGAEVLSEGGIIAMYPEGTRGGDSFVHKGHTGVVRTALQASKLVPGGNVPIVPIGMIGMRELNPPGDKFRLRPGRCTIVVGDPIYPLHRDDDQPQPWLKELAMNMVEGGSMLKGLATNVHARFLTNYLMKEIARLSTAHYLDEYLKIGATGQEG